MISRPALLVLATLAVGCAHGTLDRPYVRSLELRGVHNVSERRLRGGLVTKPTPWWRKGPLHAFDELELERDRVRIQRYYEGRGYFATRVVLAEGRRHENAVDVVIGVEEGAPTLIGDVAVFGLDGVDSTTKQKLERYQLGLRRGQVFHHDDYLKLKMDFARVLEKGGYADARVEGTVSIEPSSNLANITLRCEPHGAAPTAAGSTP